MIKKLTKALREDKECYYAWQSNIAMSFYDSYINRLHKSEKRCLNRGELHSVANDAAKSFLNLLIK
jgi:hypothetical protein